MAVGKTPPPGRGQGPVPSEPWGSPKPSKQLKKVADDVVKAERVVCGELSGNIQNLKGRVTRGEPKPNLKGD